MGIHNNTPTFTWISIKGLNIQKGDKIYSVQDIKTNLEHLYWELDNPYVLRPSGENLGTSGNRYLLYRNNAGEVVEVPNDDLQITYNDPNNNIAFEEKISVISEKSKENGKKMVAIEQDVNGVKQTVGNWNVEKNGTITENLTQIKQTNKELDFKVQQTEKTFNEDKFIEKLRENFSKAIIDFNGQLGIMDAQFYGYFKDNIISDEEKLNIESLLGLLGNKKSEVILQTNELIKLAEVQGQTTQKNTLISERDKFSDMMDNLNQYVKTAITDGIMSTSDITGVTNLISKCSTSITSLKNTADDFLFLGSGGKIIDELARIGVKSNEILLSVSNTEELIKNTLGVEKNLLQGHVTDFQNANADVKYQVDIYSQDGKATDEEKESLNESINKLNKERNDISHKFDELYNNKYLTVKSKNELKTEYDKFINKSNEANVKIIQYFGDGFINDIEKNEVDILLNESISFLLPLNTKMCQAIDEIDDETKKAELQAAKDEMKKEISDVTGDVKKLSNYVDGTFKNNVIDDNERRILKQTLSNLETEKVDIDNTYKQLSESVYLDGLMKTEFQNTYQDLNDKYIQLKKVIDNVLNKQTSINESDRSNVDNVKNIFNISLGNFTRLTNKVIEYIGNKQVAKISDNFNQELNGLNIKMEGMQKDIKNATLDGVLDESEKISLRNNIQLLENEFSKNESEFLKIYKNPNLIGDIKTQLQSTYNDYTLKYGVLMSFIEDLINKKDEIIEQDKTNLDTNYTNYRDAIKLYSEKVYEALDNIKNKGIEDMETQFNKDIGDVSKAVVKLENNMNTVFKDGVLSDSEKIGLKQSLQSIQKDKIDVDNGYNSLHSNEYLIDNAKTNLENAYNDYISKYTNLVNVTNTIINKTGIVDTSDQQKFKDIYNNFINISGIYTKRVNEALDAITKRKADLAEKNSRTYTDSKIKVLNDEINLKVSKKEYDANNIKLNEKLTEINQTSELITLKVNDIQNDYVTSTTLEQTQEDFKFKFQNQGNDNLIKNAWMKAGLDYWFYSCWNNGDSSERAGGLYLKSDGYYVPKGQNLLQISNFGTPGNKHWHGATQRVNVEASNTYTLSYYVAQHRCRRNIIEIKRGDDDQIIKTGVVDTIKYGKENGCTFENDFTFVTLTFTVPSDCTEIKIMLWAEGRDSSDNTNPSFMWFGQIQLEKGSSATGRRVSPNEVYSATTKVDRNGITVYHDDGNYTQMSARGFKRHRANGDALGDYHYLTHYVGFVTTGGTSDYVWIQLPDDFKGKHFAAYSVISDTWDDSWNWGEPWVLQRFVTFVETSKIDYANARVPIRGYRTDKNYSTGERRTRPVAGVLLVIA